MLDLSESTLYIKLYWTAFAITGIYLYLKFVVYSYWKRRGISCDAPVIPFGHILPVLLGKICLGDFVKRNYDNFKSNPFNGLYIFFKPVLMVNDPELVRLILIKEFNRFGDRGIYFNEKVDPLSAHLLSLPAERWGPLRAKLSPAFTSAKVKQMFPLLMKINNELINTINRTLENTDTVDLKEMSSRYTMDNISTIAFGYNCNSLQDPKTDFRRYGELVFDIHPLRAVLGAYLPNLLAAFQASIKRKEVIEYFSNIFRNMVKYRLENNIVRNDLLNILIQLLNKNALNNEELSPDIGNYDSSNEKLTMSQAEAQAFVMFVAGYETTATAITCCLYELAMNPEIQTKLHEEIDEYFKDSEYTYAKILNELEYLHIVLSETLRKHPPIPYIHRVCMEDYNVPDSNFRIEKGTQIVISIAGIHNNPDIYPDPDKFDPSRFTKENMAARNSYVYLPFACGPRNCIGARVGMLQIKSALVSLLSNYKFSICEKTPIPLRHSVRSVVQTLAGNVYLRVEKRRP